MKTAKKPTRAVKSSPKKKSSLKKTLWSWFWRLSILFILALSVWLVYLDAQVRSQFDGNKWALPAKVYARPLSLYPGLLLSAQQLKAELQWNDYKAVSHVVSPGTYGRDGRDWIIYRRAFSFADRTEDAVKIRLSLTDGRIEQLSVAGQIRGLERIEPQYIGGIFPSHHEDRDLIALQDVPPELVAALVAVEDRGRGKGVARAGRRDRGDQGLARAPDRGRGAGVVEPAHLVGLPGKAAHGEPVFSPQLASLVLGEFRRMSKDAGGVQPISEREREVLQYVARGHTYKEIGEELFISPKTVENHVRNILGKLHLNRKQELIRYALEHGIE